MIYNLLSIFNGDKVLFYQDTVSSFPNFSVLLGFVTVISCLSKTDICVFLVIKFPNDRKLLPLMKGHI